jgi:hypothetical protein
MIINNFGLKQMLPWALMADNWKETTEEMAGERNRPLAQLLGRNVTVKVIIIMKKMNNYA